MRDISHNFGTTVAVAPAVLTATNTSAAIDLKGFNAAAVVIATGAIAGSGNFTPKLQESDDGTTFNDVAAEGLTGTFPTALAANGSVKVGYIGFKRYIRTVLTLNSGTSIAASAVVIKGRANNRPVA